MDERNLAKYIVGLFTQGKLYISMVALQFGYAGMNIIGALALKKGLSHYSMVVYRHAVATLVIGPFALLLERKVRPKMTLKVFLQIMALGLLEPVIDQNLYYAGMNMTSATFSSSMVNILPAITFVLAFIFRFEKVKIKEIRSQAKVLGTLVTVGGAMVMTLYKGPILEMAWSKGGTHDEAGATDDGHTQWVKGSLMLLVGCFSWSSFVILQAMTLRSYPAELTLTSLICFMGTLEGAIVSLIMNRGNVAIWSIGWDSRLIAIVYMGVISSGIAYYVQGMVMKVKGPVFITAFSPLTMIIVTFLGTFILAEQIYLGRIIGAIIIVVGLYSVVWGKGKDNPPLPEEMPKDGMELPTVTKMEEKKTDNDRLVSIQLSKAEVLSKVQT